MRLCGVLLVLLSLTLASAARAQSDMDEALRDRLDNLPVALESGCADLNRSDCSGLLARVSARAALAGVGFTVWDPVPAPDPVGALCKGALAAAILPRDAIGPESPCPDRMAVVGSAMFPFYAMLVVRANSDFHNLGDLAERGGKIITDRTSRVTLQALPRTRPVWRPNIIVFDGEWETALGTLWDEDADAVFAMIALESPLVDRVRQLMGANGKPRFRVIDIHPDPAFFRIGDSQGHCLYRAAGLDFGMTGPVTTISVDAVMVLTDKFREAHARGGPPVPIALADAIEVVRPRMLTDTKSPPGWREALASCH